MQDVAAIAALQRECEHVGTLDHPNILRVDGVHRTGRHTWIAMEYASGGDLSRCAAAAIAVILARLCRSPWRWRTRIAQASSIATKPPTSCSASDGAPRLADFGGPGRRGEARGQRRRGSPYSMSPQQAAGEPTPADDVYGFGAMLYELLSGYPPSYGNGKLAALPPRYRAAQALLVTWMLADLRQQGLVTCRASSVHWLLCWRRRRLLLAAR